MKYIISKEQIDSIRQLIESRKFSEEDTELLQSIIDNIEKNGTVEEIIEYDEKQPLSEFIDGSKDALFIWKLLETLYNFLFK